MICKVNYFLNQRPPLNKNKIKHLSLNRLDMLSFPYLQRDLAGESHTFTFSEIPPAILA
jgi:hypothetical protein